MAGAACKVIINMIIRAIVSAVETILLNPNVHTGRLPEETRLALIQRLADIDLAVYTGEVMPAGGVRGIVLELQKHGLVTDEIWVLLARLDAVTEAEKPSKPKPLTEGL